MEKGVMPSMIWLLLSLTLTLQTHAQTHANHLAETGTFTHSDLTPLLAVCDWAGETIYRGHSNPETRWGLYQDSPSHAYVVDYPWTHHASGHAVMSDGRHVVVDIYCVRAAPVAVEPQPEPEPLPPIPTPPR